MQMLLPAPTFTKTALATVCPTTKLRFDASGGAMPQGYTVRNPAPPGSVTVTFTTTVSASPGIEPRPITGRVVTVPAGWNPIPLNCPSTVVRPPRDSSRRAGFSDRYVVTAGK